MPETGWKIAGTGASIGSSSWAWMTPEAITSIAGASRNPDMGSGPSRDLRASNFGFSIPTGEEITGVAVRIAQYTDVTSIVEESVTLTLAGSANRATGAPLPLPMAHPGTEIDYGGSADLWGLAITRAQVVATTFGVNFQVRGLNSEDKGSAYVSAIWMNVYYGQDGNVFERIAGTWRQGQLAERVAGTHRSGQLYERVSGIWRS